MINNFIAYLGASYIRDLTVVSMNRVSIGSDNGLWPIGAKPLPEPVQTSHQPAVGSWELKCKIKLARIFLNGSQLFTSLMKSTKSHVSTCSKRDGKYQLFLTEMKNSQN